MLGTNYRLRVTATCMLADDAEGAVLQRAQIKAAMAVLREILGESGIGIEYVVGAPRSPEVLRTSLTELVEPT